MADKVVATFKGLDNIAQIMRSLPVEVQKRALGSALLAGAEVVRKEAQLHAPVRQSGNARRINRKGNIRAEGDKGRLPGFLRASIVKRLRRTANVGAAMTASVGWTKDAFYGRFLEFGTKFMAAQPFLRPALDNRAGEASRRIGEILGPKIIQTARRLSRRR